MREETRAEWKRLNEAKRNAIEAFRDIKYGMFIHWGLYSELAGVYKGQKLEEMGRSRLAEWAMHAFQIPREEYGELTKQFNPSGFDAEALVQLAVDAGMKYLVITAKHHDGFALFKSEASSFNVVDATPFGRDIVAELHAACKKADIRFGLYYSHSIDWTDGGDGGYADHFETSGWTRDFRPNNAFDPAPVSFGDYREKKALPQMREILSRYPNLIEIWYDVPFVMSDEESLSFYKVVSELQPETLVSARVGNDYGDFGTPGDNVVPDELVDQPWETPGTTNNSWGFKSYDTDWKDPAETLFWIVNIVSKGGNYLLNVGPRADGIVPEESAAILRRVGQWLSVNGEAIYGSRPWKVAHEGPTSLSMAGTSAREDEGFSARFTAQDFWFTCKGKSLYAISLRSGLSGEIVIASLSGVSVSDVSVLGASTVTWSNAEDGLHVTLTSQPDELGTVMKVTLA